MASKHLSALICPEDSIATDVAPLERWAANRQLPCWQVGQNSLENELKELINETTPDLFLVYGFPYAIPGQLLRGVKYGGWNVHFSLQPDQHGSITIHQLAEDITGEKLIHQHQYPLLPFQEGGSAIDQLSHLSVMLLQASICTMQTV